MQEENKINSVIQNLFETQHRILSHKKSCNIYSLIIWNAPKKFLYHYFGMYDNGLPVICGHSLVKKKKKSRFFQFWKQLSVFITLHSDESVVNLLSVDADDGIHSFIENSFRYFSYGIIGISNLSFKYSYVRIVFYFQKHLPEKCWSKVRKM